MSRCGSCCLYWFDDKGKYGVTCEGDLGDEECADKLQQVISSLQDESKKTKLTEYDKLVISAYTGYLMCDFADLHRFIEETLGRPVLTHELAQEAIYNELREKLKSEWARLGGKDGGASDASKEIQR